MTNVVMDGNLIWFAKPSRDALLSVMLSSLSLISLLNNGS